MGGKGAPAQREMQNGVIKQHAKEAENQEAVWRAVWRARIPQISESREKVLPSTLN